MAYIVNVARYICKYYKEITNEDIDELKLQKLVYFCQREKLAIVNEPLFDDTMKGWMHGPVSIDVRKSFRDKEFCNGTAKLSDEDGYIIRNVVGLYGEYESWKLADLSHKEYSWNKSREGLKDGEKGDRDILIDDIRVDAKKVRPFDYAWGMYYDEFEDVEVN